MRRIVPLDPNRIDQVRERIRIHRRIDRYFGRLVDCPIDLYSVHAIRREGSAYAQGKGVAVLL